MSFTFRANLVDTRFSTILTFVRFGAIMFSDILAETIDGDLFLRYSGKDLVFLGNTLKEIHVLGHVDEKGPFLAKLLHAMFQSLKCSTLELVQALHAVEGQDTPIAFIIVLKYAIKFEKKSQQDELSIR